MDRIETERLVGTRPLPRDADELAPLMGDERVARWLWPGDLGGPRTLAQTRTFVIRDIDHWKRHGFGPYVVRDRATRAVVGRIGLEHTEVGGRAEVEVLWLVDADRWGEGLATEFAAAALAVAPVESVVAFTLHDNVASRRVMERLGMTYERDVEHAALAHVLYRLQRV